MKGCRSSVTLPWRISLHVLSILGLVGVLVAFAPQPAAAYDLCSEDPVFTFRHGSLLTLHVIDVEVIIPVSALPLPSPATLTVTVPSDVAYHERLRTRVPGFVLNTVFQSGPASPGRYPLTFAALVPTNGTPIPVRLVVLNPRSGLLQSVDGTAGIPVTTTIYVGR